MHGLLHIYLIPRWLTVHSHLVDIFLYYQSFVYMPTGFSRWLRVPTEACIGIYSMGGTCDT